MEDISKYIVNIVSYKSNKDERHGIGVLVGNLLITAGHVVNAAENVYALLEGMTISLDKTNLLFCQSMGNEDTDPFHNDIAIYRIEEMYSPLTLSQYLPEEKQNYSNAYYIEGTNISDDENLLEIFRKTITLSFEQSNSVFWGEVSGNFFSCKTEKILTEGLSGCPLLKDNIVYGILVRGLPGHNKCVYQSSQSILNCLKK